MEPGRAGRAAAAALLAFTFMRAARGDLPPEQVDVFLSGRGGYHTYRIPALVVSRKGTALAFAEGRKDGRGDSGDIDLLLRRSADGGRTWGPFRVLVDDGPDTAGNPAPVVDTQSGDIWLLFSRNSAKGGEDAIIHGKAPRSVWATRSSDDGETWAGPRDLTAEVKRPEWTWYATGPGHGIQLASGRLVISCDHVEGIAAAPDHARFSRSHVIYSDDRGQSWRIGGVADRGTNESTVVELGDGSLYLNCRNYQGARRRAYAVSRDAGLSFGERLWDEALPEPICQASALRLRAAKGGAPAPVLFSNPASEKREKLTIRASHDGCRTWKESRLLHAGPAAYSDLAQAADGAILCLYERGEKHFSEKITLARFGLDWVTGGGDGTEAAEGRKEKP